MSSAQYQHVVESDPNDDSGITSSYEQHGGPVFSQTDESNEEHRTPSSASGERKNSDLSSSQSSFSSSLSRQCSSISLESLGHKRRRIWAAALFSISTVLLFADQNLMSPNLTSIAREFDFNDNERDKKLGGDIALAFWILGAPASLIVGCAGDRFNRSKLFALTVGIGEGACLATFFARTYPQLYVCRAVTGFSIGGAIPLIYSVISDLFVAEQRHGVSAMVGIGSGVGISFGQGVAGYLGPTFGWRLPFLVISVPALICAMLVYCTVEDPERGGMEQAVRQHKRQQQQQEGSNHEPAVADVEMIPLDNDKRIVANDSRDTDTAAEVAAAEIVIPEDGWDEIMKRCDMRGQWNTFKIVCSTPTVVLTMLQGAPGCVPWGIVNTYLNDFLSENRGMSVEYATSTVLMFGLGSFSGMVLGGGGGSYLYQKDQRYPVLFSGSMAILGCIPFWILLNFVDNSTPFLQIAVIAVIAGLCASATGPIVKATLQNVTLPETRGQAFALYNTFDDFGRGLGPVFLAGLIGKLGDRTPAFNIGVFGWVLCGIFNLSMFCTVARDEDHIQALIASRLSKNPEIIPEAVNGADGVLGIMTVDTRNRRSARRRSRQRQQSS